MPSRRRKYRGYEDFGTLNMTRLPFPYDSCEALYAVLIEALGGRERVTAGMHRETK